MSHATGEDELERAAELALDQPLPDAATASFDRWTPVALDRLEREQLAVVLLVRRSGRNGFFAMTVICHRSDGTWTSVDGAGNGDRWEVDPTSRPDGAGFVWTISTSGTLRHGRRTLSTAGVVGDRVKSLTVQAAGQERSLRIQPSGAFVVLVNTPTGVVRPSFALRAVNADGSTDELEWELPENGPWGDPASGSRTL